MLNRIILWSLRNRIVVLAMAALLLVFGVRTARNAPLDGSISSGSSPRALARLQSELNKSIASTILPW